MRNFYLLLSFFVFNNLLAVNVCPQLTEVPIFNYNECTNQVSFSINVSAKAGSDKGRIAYYYIQYKYSGQTTYTTLLELKQVPMTTSIPGVTAGSKSYSNTGDIIFHLIYPNVNFSTNTTTWSYGATGIGQIGYYNFTWDVPISVLEAGGIEFQVYRTYSHLGTINCTSLDNTTINLHSLSGVPSYDAPSNLSATTNSHCDKIQLDWDKPTGVPACINSIWKTYIYRKTSPSGSYSYLDNVGGSTETFNDITAVAGTSYSYKLNTRVRFEGDFSTSVTGKRKAIPSAPTNPTATTTNCDGTINLTWSNVSGADDYNVYWATNYATNINPTNYTFNSAVRGTNYTFQIKANNNCGLGTSAFVTGVSPADATAATNLTAVHNTSGVQLSWIDGSYETELKLIKTNVTSGATSNILLSANDVSYLDTDIDACKEYTYYLESDNNCNSIAQSSAINILVNSNLTGTFNTNALNCSKGYYSNRVELTWTVQNNASLLNGYEIRRKILGDSGPSALLNSVNNPNSNIYLDYLADAGVLYEYTLIGFGDCNGVTLYSDTVKSVGFKSATGIINGEVSYTGGIAVEDVKVLVENVSGASGNSLQFNGSSKAENLTPSFDNAIFADLTVEAWVKLDVTPTGEWNAISDCEGVQAVRLGGNATDVFFKIENNGSTVGTASIPISNIIIGDYNHLAGVYETGGKMKLYLNGNLVAQYNPGGAILNIQITSICLGDGLNGKLEEARFFNYAKDSTEILKTYSIKSSNTENGLLAVWNFDETFGNNAYDKSHSGAFYNKNHCNLIGNITWSTDIPTSGQLGLAAYTNSSGDYNIIVPYSGVGQNFTITPVFGVHGFNPSNQVLFIGDGSTVQNNIDFEDVSSFQVMGAAYYNNTSCPVEGAFLKIDGNIVVSAGVPVETNSLGQFDIQVPIGEHVVTIEKAGHIFNDARFPPIGLHDFQAPITGIQFSDSTLIKVIGRVVGGLRESTKFPGVGRSKNNIGVAQIIFNTQSGCNADTIFTNPLTGEYEVFLLPTKHIIDLKIPSDLAKNFGTLDLLNLDLIPPMQTLIDTASYDSLFMVYNLDSVSFQKKLDFTYRNTPSIDVLGNDILGLSLERFKGDRSIDLVDYSNSVDTTYSIELEPINPFLYDVFTEKHKDQENFKYKAYILAYEEYTNYDGMIQIFDTVPISDGKILIDNQLASFPVTAVELSSINTNPDKLSYLIYDFEVGKPNFNNNTSIPEFSYTKTMTISIETNTGQIITWKPLIHPVSGLPDVYRAYLLGSQNFGNSFVTTGPESVDFVLRDPPGGNSSATRSIGQSTSTTESWGWNLGLETNNADVVDIGVKMNIGTGVSTVTEIEQNTSIGSSTSISGGHSGSISKTIETTTEWSTNGNPANIGSGSDIFVGHSTNIEFGVTDYLRLVPDSMCLHINCLQSVVPGFSMAKTSSLSIVPKGYNTGFIYTQNFIETILIPNLKNLRNTVLQSDPKFTSVLPIGHANYGKNNDDPIFGAGATIDSSILNIPDDYTGLSYNFVPANLTDSLLDTIRLMNQQISLWEKAIYQNEFEKVNIESLPILNELKQKEIDNLELEYLASNILFFSLQAAGALTSVSSVLAGGITAIAPAPGYATVQSIAFGYTTIANIAATETLTRRFEYLSKLQDINNKFSNIVATNHSISGGATFTNSISSERVVSEAANFEFGASAGLANEISGKVSNTGVGFSSGISVNFARSSEKSIDSTFSNTVSYTLDDGDNADFFSVDVFPSFYGWGPIFKRRAGGKTSCPHEPEEVTKYYNPGTVINEATLQRDLPGIAVDLPIITNVPTDQPAIFNLTVSNNTQTGDDMPYVVTALTANNPFGAIIRINGSASQTPQITAGTSINMTLTVEKGPGAIYDYDSLLIIVHSVCQYDFGISPIFKDIADSLYVSAHFIPTCTDVELLNPSDNWVLNNSYQDTFPVITSGYNINFFDLERFRVEYKSSSDPNWIGLQSFWKDTTGQPSYLPISSSLSYTSYDWITNQIPDGNYDLRVTSLCSLADVNSPIYSGVMDRINPHNFGTPSPADGILDSNDDISIRFNEPIDLGSISPLNFDIRGVLNATALSHSTSLYFDGIDDELLISAGANIQNRDFTIEFWAKRNTLGQQTVFSQGLSSIENLSIGFDATNKFNFKIGTTAVSSTASSVDNNWHHYAASYNFDNETVELFIDGSLVNNGNINFYPNFVNTDALIIGKNAATNTGFFDGNIHEMRVWNNYRTLSDIVPDMNVSLSKSELGLLYNWKMDEATGNFAKDQIRNRDAVINGAEWQIDPNGNAISLDGVDDYIEISNTGNVAITDEMDFTLEFWFNSSSTQNATLFSNGTGTNLSADSLTSWSIQKDASGQIHIYHNGEDFVATNNNYFDGEWHHFAIVFQRTGNLSAYIDGNIENSTQATNFNQFGGAKMFLGARGFYQGSTLMVDSFSNAMFDEFRFWNTARKVEQVSRDKQNRLLGDESGLISYLPFEEYTLVLGVPVLTASLIDIADATHIATLMNGAISVNTTPTIKLQRPIQQVNFTYSLNGDEIIITPTTPSELIENVTLDITVSGLEDLHGNTMQSPKTWIAYIDKNQVVWQDELLVFSKDFGAPLSFTSAVVNNGGSVKSYDITNLPSWLSVSQTSGTIAPNSVEQITFTVDANVNIGDYLQDLHLTTDFGFAEKLTIELKVRAEDPAWTVNPADYTNSMSIIGFIEINDVVSTSAEDMLSVFVGTECRGVANLQYVPQMDRYLVFLDVYSNLNNGENLTFKVWDASSGTIFSEISPSNLNFVANDLIGTISSPQLFETSYEIEVEIPLSIGWNWISDFLMNPDSLDLDATFESLESVTGDEIKSISNFSNYLNGTGWVGSLNTIGIKPESGYKIKVSQTDTLVINGDILDPTTRNINLLQGWNWIGFISIRNQSVQNAMGNLNPTDGDIIKAKSQFAVYNTLLGWVGSLQTMTPGAGYMYYANNATNFTYPAIGQFKFGIVNSSAVYQSKQWTVNQSDYASNMTMIAKLDTDCEAVINNKNLVLGAFTSKNECRAVNTINLLGDQQISFLTIAGSNTQDLTFGILDTKTGNTYNLSEEIEYTSNQHIGKMDKPFMFTISDKMCLKMTIESEIDEELVEENGIDSDSELFQVYPTVFEDEVKLFYITENKNETVDIVLYNVWGQKVFKQEFKQQKGLNKQKIDLSKLYLPIGVYHFIVTSGLETHSVKLIKK